MIENNFIKNYEGFIFDLDGTIYLENKIISKADLVIKQLKEIGKKVIFVSNKTTGTIKDYKNFLCKNGVEVQQNEIITSTMTTIDFLIKNYPDKKYFAIGERKFIKQLNDAGLEYSDNKNEIEIVLVTLDRTLNYTKLEIAAKALDNGAHFFAANIDNTCPIDGGEILDAGSTISALESRTDRKLEMNFGKPSEFMVNEILRRLNLPAQKCLIIGDRLETDIAMGNLFEIDTVLVSTGVHKNYNTNLYQPTYRIKSIGEII